MVNQASPKQPAPDHPEAKVKRIIQQISKFRGRDPTNTTIDKMLQDVSCQQMQARFRSEYAIDTAQKV